MLSTKDKCALRRQAHSLKPIVIIGGKGLTDAVHAEIERALDDHELVKIRARSGAVSDWTVDICQSHAAHLIQVIGHTATIYRKRSRNQRST